MIRAKFINRIRHFTSRHLSQSNKQTEPQFDEVVIFYNFVFDVGGFVNPTEAARRLLDQEFALSAANYLTDEIELATRFKKLDRMRSYMGDLREIYERLEKRGIRGVVGWILRNPTRVRWLWRMWWAGLSSNEKQLDQARTEVDGTEEGIRGVTEETIEFLDEAMAHVQLFGALQRCVDRTVFSPHYLQEVPFTRIGLQPFFVTIDGKRIAVDVSVLIHRTGVAILTFYVTFDGCKSADELINLQLANQVQVEGSEVVRAVVEPQAHAFGLQSSDLDRAAFERRHSGGVEWFVYRNQDDATLDGMFELYQMAIISAIQEREPQRPTEPWSWLRTGDWLAYPIVFVRRVIPVIPDSSTFRCQYPMVLTGLIQRFPCWRDMRDENIKTVIGTDFSMTRDHSLYIETSHTTVLYYEPYRL